MHLGQSLLRFLQLLEHAFLLLLLVFLDALEYLLSEHLLVLEVLLPLALVILLFRFQLLHALLDLQVLLAVLLLQALQGLCTHLLSVFQLFLSVFFMVFSVLSRLGLSI